MTLRLPVPPSVNSLYANIPGVGRITSRRYKAWRKEVWWCVLTQKPKRVTGPYRISIVVPRKMRGDLDNRIKPTLDALVLERVTPDDSLCAGVSIKRGDVAEMEIEIEPLHMRETA